VSTSSLEPDPPLAEERLVRAHAGELRDLATRYGIAELRFASAGRLVGRVPADKDLLDVAAFDVEATDLLGASVMLFSDAVLSKENVSPDLVAASPL
jgi:hypothetical protein